MGNLISNIVPILLLIIFGMILRKINYFEEVSMRRLTSMVATLLVPCVIFSTFLNLDIRMEYLWISLTFMLYQAILLAVSWIIYKVFKIKRRFFLFFNCAFAFGFMALPLFTTVFGTEHIGYLTALGVGHELFVGLFFITGAKLFLKNERTGLTDMGKTLLSPLFIMLFLALFIKVFDLKSIIESNVIGKGFIDAVAKLGSMTSILTMIIVGYRISLKNMTTIKESIYLVITRYALTFGIGYLIKYLIIDKIVASNIYFDYAFFTLLSQHGSVVLNAFVGEYGTQEDLEVASNAFVINAITGIVLYIIFVFFI
jgi:predicted permease